MNCVAPVSPFRPESELVLDLLIRLTSRSEREQEAMPGRYYHVIFRDGAWHLYLGDGGYPLLVDQDKAAVLRAARSRARMYRMKVIVHRAPHEEERGPGRP